MEGDRQPSAMEGVERKSLPGMLAAATDAGADYPHKPVRIVVPAPPGGTIDPITRILAEALGKSFSQTP